MSHKNAGSVVTLAYGGHSDGDSTHRPGDERWQKCSPDWVRKVYLSKLGQKYMEDTKQAEAGKQASSYSSPIYATMLLLSNQMTVIFLSRRVPRGLLFGLRCSSTCTFPILLLSSPT